MQLKTKLSIIACSLLVGSSLMAEDYVSVQYVQYDESDDRASISSPTLELSKDFGVDYNLKVGLAADSVSGASPTWYDSTSGASAYSRGTGVSKDDIEYGNVIYDDDRIAVNALLTTRFESRDELVVGGSYSYENDYDAREISAEYLHYLGASKNQSISLGLAYQFNKILVGCYENDECDASSGASQTMDLNVISGEVGFTQILNESSLAKVSLFYSNEDGYLSNPYMNVVRSAGENSPRASVVAENKPDERISYGLTMQYSVAITDKLSSSSNYRLYNDDWEIMSHTISSELYYEIGRSWIVGTGLRYYTQSESSFYNAGYFSDEEYASSDERMRNFYAMGYKVSADYQITKDLSTNIGLNYYDQEDTFDAIYYNVGLKYRF